MTEREHDDTVTGKPAGAEGDELRPEERVLDPANLDAARHQVRQLLLSLLEQQDTDGVRALALSLSPGDLAEVVRPLDMDDTAAVLRNLPPDPLAYVLGEIDNRSLSVLFDLLDVDAIADIIEEMPSDEGADLLGELDARRAQEILAAMDEEERAEVSELLGYPPESAGGIMDKEFVACRADQSCGEAIALLKTRDEDDLENTHFVFVLDDRGRLVGRLPLIRLLVADRDAPVGQVMEPDPLYVEVDLDQEDVAGYFMTHDLISLPVVDHRGRMVGRITADDIMDVLEEEATEDISRLAGVSVAEFGEQSALRVARSRLPWLLGALLGQFGAVLVMRHFEQSLQTMVTLAFYIPVIMALAGNVGIQTSSVVVRGLATGELALFHVGRHVLREMATSLVIGLAVAVSLVGVSYLVNGNMYLSLVLGVSMLLVVLMASMVGTCTPLLLHRLGADPAVATGPFITTSNDLFGLAIYLGLATLMLSLGHGGAP
ncbi:MAG: magnesium transporter [Candidatus Krumholzibacteriia bacterium]